MCAKYSESACANSKPNVVISRWSNRLSTTMKSRVRACVCSLRSFCARLHHCFPDSQFIQTQSAVLEHLSDFPEEIASARTFVFVREIEPLLHMGLIKGGDLSNALVIYERRVDQARLDKLSDSLGVKHLDANQLGYIQERPVTWENEPARHKLLDIIGDMALIGRPLKGRIIAIRPGHEANNKFARLVRSKLLHS